MRGIIFIDGIKITNDIIYLFCIFIPRCASWSPNGEQIVVPHAGGKLALYNADLKLDRIVSSTATLLRIPFYPMVIYATIFCCICRRKRGNRT